MSDQARRASTLATLALLAMTASWGSTFFLIHDLLVRIPTPDFLAVRFLIASVFLLLAAPRAIVGLSAAARRRAIVLGVLYGIANIAQTAGLAHTAASTSGFITGMYVVLTPVLAAALLKSRIGGWTWFAVLLALGGLGVLSLSGLSLGYGEAITLVAAALYALHIVGLGAWSTPGEALGIAILQIVVIDVVCWIFALPGGVTLPHRTDDWLSLVYMALIAGALAMLAQTWAQSHLAPTRTAIIMSAEPVFAALFAISFGSESLTARMLIGGSLVVAAMLIVELVPRRHVEGEVTHLTV